MNLRFFIDRPVFSGVISVVIVLMGVIAMKALPVEQYPDIAPPTINVWASYPGANAETVQKAVIVPLEEAINGVEDMTFQAGCQRRHGGGQCAEPRERSAEPASGGSDQDWCHHREAAERRVADIRPLQPRQPFRPDLSQQLRED